MNVPVYCTYARTQKWNRQMYDEIEYTAATQYQYYTTTSAITYYFVMIPIRSFN